MNAPLCIRFQPTPLRQNVEPCERHIKSGQPITNPVCADDVLTDRWTISIPQASGFVNNIRDFAVEIRKIRSGIGYPLHRKTLRFMMATARFQE